MNLVSLRPLFFLCVPLRQCFPDYALRSMQPRKFGLFCSSTVTGKFTSVPYDAALEERSGREDVVLRTAVLRIRRRRSPSR